MLSSLLPQAEYAEDQRFSKTILTTHVLYRGLQTGAVIGTGVGAVRALRLFRQSVPRPLVGQLLLRSIGVGGVTGVGLMAVALPLRMMGREEVEWQDRSYRLLANKYQEQVDDWTLVGSALGAASVTASGAVRNPGVWKALLGGVGAGNLAGLAGLMIWRLMVRGESSENIKPSGPLDVPSVKS